MSLIPRKRRIRHMKLMSNTLGPGDLIIPPGPVFSYLALIV
jgi:hypothetical protein